MFIATNGLWSQPGNWESGHLPVAGDNVRIGSGRTVTLDTSTPALKLVTIENGGSLVFLDSHGQSELVLQTEGIDLDGTLAIGTEAQPYTSRAAIELLGAAQPESTAPGMAAVMGHKRISMHGGNLLLYGAFQGNTWTRLSQTAAAGATTIQVDSTAGWQVGEQIVVTSSDFYQNSNGLDRQTEERVVAGISGTTVTLNQPLSYMHYGQAQQFADANNQPRTLESRAEVIRLNRNIVIRSEDATAQQASDRYRFGGQVMAMGASDVQLHGVEVTKMGQHGRLLRYPIHFHLMRDNGAGCRISKTSIHHVYNRGITIHGTNGVTVENSAIYHTFGHAYFLEDGAETGNVLTGNIAAQIIRPDPANALLASDINGSHGPTAYWITNPDNTLTGNVAASVRGAGFWYALPANPTGGFAQLFPQEAAAIFPRRTPLGAFEGNVAHSIGGDACRVDDGPAADGSTTEVTSYAPRIDPTNSSSAPVQAIFANFSAWKINRECIWTRGSFQTIRGGIMADHLKGITMASSNTSRVEDVVFVGETANLGTPSNAREVANGRSMPRSYESAASNHLTGYAFPIAGFSFYDRDVFISDSSFHNYQQNSNRYASALAINDWTEFGWHPRNGARNLKFHNSLRFWYGPIPPNRTGNQDGYRQAIVLDTDGSITGTSGSVLIPATNTLLNQNATQIPAWGLARRNDTDFAQVNFYTNVGGAPPSTPAPLQFLTVASGGGSYSNNGNSDTPANNPSAIVPAYGGDFRVTYTGVMPNQLQIRLDDYPSGFDPNVPSSQRPYMTLRMDYPAGRPVYIYRDYINNAPLQAAASLAAFNAQTPTQDSLYYRDTSTNILHIRLYTRTSSSGAIRSYAVAVIRDTPSP